jgi:hypothetical protein
MKKPYWKKPASLSLFPLVAVAALVALQSASAIITLDLRAVSISPGAGAVLDPKNVSIFPNAPAGTLVTIEVWAVVTGTNGTVDETLTSLGGFSILSSPGNVALADTGITGNNGLSGLSFASNLRGSLSNQLASPWGGASTASSGTAVDLDADGDADIGSGSALPNIAFVQANTGAGPQSTGTAGNFNQLSNGREWKLSIATFNIGAVTGGAGAGINAVFGSGSAANEATRSSFAADTLVKNGGDVNMAVAAPIQLSVVPEPSAFGMMLLGGMGLVGFRRLGLRRA